MRHKDIKIVVLILVLT